MPWHVEFDVTHLLLASSYFALAIATCFFMVKALRIGSDHNAIWHRLFYPLLFVGAFARGVYYVLEVLVREHIMKLPNWVNYELSTYPAFIFFSCYFIIVFRWIEIYHTFLENNLPDNTSSISPDKLRSIFYLTNIFMYMIVLLLTALDFIFGESATKQSTILPTDITPYELALLLLDSLMYVVITLLFLWYGGRVCLTLQLTPVMDPHARKKLLLRLRMLSILCSLCFMVRAGIVMWSLNHDISAHWWVEPLYFLTLEILPLVIMLRMLHVNPRKHSVSLPYTGHSQDAHSPARPVTFVRVSEQAGYGTWTPSPP